MRLIVLAVSLLAASACAPANSAGSIVIFGDSFSAGAGTDLKAPELWPSKLEGLLDRDGDWAVSNRSINGNGLVWKTRCFGEPAMDRLQSNLQSLPRGSIVIVMAGVNDTIQPHLPDGFSPCFEPADWSAERMTSRLQPLLVMRGERRILVATIPPFGASEFHSAKPEAIRQDFNRWLRANWPKDYVIDLAMVLADSRDPNRLRRDYDSGDGLHPNEKGAAAIAAAVTEMLR